MRASSPSKRARVSRRLRLQLGLLLAAQTLAACNSGGGSSSNIDVDIPVAPEPTTQPVFQELSFESPVALLQAPGDSSRWYVVEQAGRVLVFANTPNVSASQVFIDIRDRVVSGGERGLLGMAFHPDFQSNGQVFLSYTRSEGGLVSYVSRFFSFDNGQTLDPNSEQVVLQVLQDFDNHNGGHIAFGTDGLLHVGLGDGGGANDPNNRAQDTTNLLGAMLRIDVDSGSPYGIPPDNPFAGNPRCTQGFGATDCPEIYAWGFRNPWRWSFDSFLDELWLGDVGQSDWEEADVVEAGANYGWPIREGAHCNPNTFFGETCDTTGLIDPVTEYRLSDGQSITGGYVYRGSSVGSLFGVYLYGDFISGQVFQYSDAGLGRVVSGELFDTDFRISSFGQANDGELYLLDYASGTIHQIVEEF